MRAAVLVRRVWTVCALDAASSYIQGLSESQKKKVWALLERTADHGPPRNREKFNKLEGEIFEFKSFQVRLPCFFQPNRVIVLTHGFRKKQDRTLRTQIQRAERLRRQYLEGGKR